MEDRNMILEDTKTDVPHRGSKTDPALRLLVVVDAPKGRKVAIFKEVLAP
jgi:hypothetical protein